MARIFQCSPGEIVFTSGGTESNNTALFGAIAAQNGKRKHIITTQVEHHAVLHPCERLEQMGCDVTYLPVDGTGLVRLEDVAAAIRPDTALISVMYGNNEVGTLQPVEAIGQLARDRGIVFHVDAVQALGKVKLDLSALPADLVSFSAHKIYGPKGIGALYIAKKTMLAPYILGGAQERKRRAGTENVAGIMGFAKAVELFAVNIDEQIAKLEQLRAAMIRALSELLGESNFTVNGHPEFRFPHILNVSFPGLDTETLLMNLDLEGIAASSGSACTSGSLETSHVLQAMHLPDEVTRSAIRFSFGLGNSIEQIETAAQKIATIWRRKTYR
jgi:cysteine desulfurase